MLLPRADLLTPLPNVLLVHFDPPRPDINRYAEQAAGEGRLVHLPIRGSAGEPDYLQVDLWTGDWSGWQQDRVHGIPWALKDDVVERVKPGDQKLQARSIDVEFSACGVRAVVTRPLGRLRAMDDGGLAARFMRLSDLDWIDES